MRTPLFGNETREWKVFRPDILQEAKRQVHMVSVVSRFEASSHQDSLDHLRF
jgi:hypothetical protein